MDASLTGTEQTVTYLWVYLMNINNTCYDGGKEEIKIINYKMQL